MNIVLFLKKYSMRRKVRHTGDHESHAATGAAEIPPAPASKEQEKIAQKIGLDV